jgi:tetratricopeptide (TPR) repeat protein
MTFKRLTILFFFVAAVSSCVSKPKVQIGDLSDDAPDATRIEMANWIDKISEGEATGAVQYFQNFQEKNPQSVYLNLSKYGLAYGLEKQEKYKESLEIFNGLLMTSKTRWPQIYAHSLYRTSFIYENTGENVKLLAALQEASTLEKDLPPEIIMAEIPARRSMIYSKMDQKDEAEKYLSEADRGLRRLMEQVQVSPKWLSKIYFQMGSLSLEQMGDQNISGYIKAFKTTQRYLLNSLAQNDTTWSAKAASDLVMTYNTFWGRIQNYGAVVVPVDLKEKQRSQFHLYADLMRVMNEALLLKPLVEQRFNDHQKKIYSYLETLDAKISNTLMTQFDQLALSEESETLNGLKRPGQVFDPKPLPSERK